MQPAKVHPGDLEPDWQAYLDRHIRIVRKMIPKMDDSLIQESWSRELDLFFVDEKFGRIANNKARPVRDLLKAMVDPIQAPSENDIRALAEGRAISLISICRLRYCLEEARRVNHVPLLEYFNVDLAAKPAPRFPVAVGRIIPSMNVFDTKRYAEVKKVLGIVQGELTAYASKALGRTLNESYFEIDLEKGSLSGTGAPSGYYRLTDHMAGIIYDFLKFKADPKGYALGPQSHYLPRDPTYGPGNGKWCRSLQRNRGNYWRA